MWKRYSLALAAVTSVRLGVVDLVHLSRKINARFKACAFKILLVLFEVPFLTIFPVQAKEHRAVLSQS